jgi:hypothetical protein
MQSRLGLGAALVHASLEVVRLGRVGQHAATPAPRCSMSSRFAHCPTEGRAMLRPIQTHLRSQGRRLLSEFEALREEQRDSDVKGGDNEAIIAEFIQRHYSTRIVVRNTSIIDTNDQQSDEVDVRGHSRSWMAALMGDFAAAGSPESASAGDAGLPGPASPADPALRSRSGCWSQTAR